MSTGTAPAGQQAGEGARQVADQAQEKAQEAATQAKSKLREQLDQRSAQAAEQINGQASDLRSVSDSLREQGKEGPAKAAARVAEYAEKVGGYLRDKDSDALLSDAESFGRRQPWAVGGGALTLGFAASRFVKASSSRRYSTRSGMGSSRSAQFSTPTPAVPAAAGMPPPPNPRLAAGATESVPSTPPFGSLPPVARTPGT